MPVKPGTAPRLAKPYQGGDPDAAIRAYVGGRPAAEILSGLLR